MWMATCILVGVICAVAGCTAGLVIAALCFIAKNDREKE